MTKFMAHLGLSRLRNRLPSCFGTGNSRTELRGCPDNDLSRTMRDIGLSSGDLRVLQCNQPGPSALMPRRLERLGLDTGYVKLFHRSKYQDLQRVCASCKAWRLCARDLASGDVQSGMGSYCLNALTIEALLLEPLPWVPSVRKC